jgi:hypothetical protein
MNKHWRSTVCCAALTGLGLVALVSLPTIVAPSAALACAPARPVTPPEGPGGRVCTSDCSYVVDDIKSP